MSITIKKHWAEKFMDWYPFNTKLYIRGEIGADWKKSSRLREELFDQLAPFFEEMREKIKKEVVEELKK